MLAILKSWEGMKQQLLLLISVLHAQTISECKWLIGKFGECLGEKVRYSFERRTKKKQLFVDNLRFNRNFVAQTPATENLDFKNTSENQ